MKNNNPWLSLPKPNPQARLRLFCFPYAGGAASIYRLWRKELPADVEVCPIQLPGRENRLREPLITDLSEMVQALLPVLEPYLNKPFAFFGYSMGGMIGYELSRKLRQERDLSPIHLFVAARRAPHKPLTEPPIYHLHEASFVRELEVRYAGIPKPVLQNAELMELFLPILRADFTLIETYHHQPSMPLNCPISVFGGVDDRSVNRHELEAWSEQTHAGFSLKMFTGGHFFINDNQESLLQAVYQDLMASLRQ